VSRPETLTSPHFHVANFARTSGTSSVHVDDICPHNVCSKRINSAWPRSRSRSVSHRELPTSEQSLPFSPPIYAPHRPHPAQQLLMLVMASNTTTPPKRPSCRYVLMLLFSIHTNHASDILASEILTIKIGPNKVQYRIYAAVLTHHSKYFRGALRSGLKESKTRNFTVSVVPIRNGGGST
jgi:hypothetical protein